MAGQCMTSIYDNQMIQNESKVTFYYHALEFDSILVNVACCINLDVIVITPKTKNFIGCLISKEL